MYLPARVWSQQNQDSKFRTGVLHILAGHSGPETAADARTHFGIFSPQVWKLFPRDQVINLSFWDYNDVAPGYFAAAEIAAREKKVGVIVIEVARPDFRVADRSTFADTDLRAAAQENVWLTGGTEADVIAEAHLDPDSIFAGVQRFAQERPKRLSRQRALLEALR